MGARNSHEKQSSAAAAGSFQSMGPHTRWATRRHTTGSFQSGDPHTRCATRRHTTVFGGNDELRMVLVGKTGVGKSAAGNSILGSKEFISKLAANSVTKECTKIQGEIEGRPVALVDTPGLFDTELTNEEILHEVVKCISMSSPGPHAFLIVIQLGRFTEEERRTVELIQNAFGEEAVRYTVVLFTRADDLEEETIEDYCQRADEHLKQLLKNCGNRCHAINNKEMSDRIQIQQLLDKIVKMVEENGGSCYTTEMYEKAEAAIEEEKNKIMKKDPGCSEEEARNEAVATHSYRNELARRLAM